MKRCDAANEEGGVVSERRDAVNEGGGGGGLERPRRGKQGGLRGRWGHDMATGGPRW